MVRLEVQIAMPRGREDALRAEVLGLLGRTRVSPGCLACRCFRDAECDAKLVLIEEWESEMQMRRHLRSEEFRLVLGLMDLSVDEPELRLDTVSRRGGLADLLDMVPNLPKAELDVVNT